MRAASAQFTVTPRLHDVGHGREPGCDGMLVIAFVALVVVVAVRRLGEDLARRGAADRDASVRAAVDTMVAIAGDQLGVRAEAGARELSMHRDAIGERLATMGEELSRVTDLVGVLQRDRATQHGELVQGLRETLRTTTELAGTTQALRAALANPKARGQWGERMADDVLRTAGLLEDVNYRKQRAIAGGTIPDFTFLLPRDVELHMDVKFPIDNYLRHLEATTEAERDATRSAFLRDVRNRIKELASRGYADPTTTPGFLLLFIPNESVYAFIQEHDHAAVRPRAGAGCRPVLAVHAVRGARRRPPGGRLLPARAGVRRDPRCAGRVLAAVAAVLRPRRQVGQAARHRAGHLRRAGRYPAPAARARLDEIEAIRTRRGSAAGPRRCRRRWSRPRNAGAARGPGSCSLDSVTTHRLARSAAFMRMPHGGRG